MSLRLGGVAAACRGGWCRLCRSGCRVRAARVGTARGVLARTLGARAARAARSRALRAVARGRTLARTLGTARARVALRLCRGRRRGRTSRDRALVLMLGAVELCFLAGVQRDAKRLGERRAQLVQVRYPIADAVNVERLARYHLRLEAVLLGFLERAGELEQLAEGEVGLDGGHDLADDVWQFRDDGRDVILSMQAFMNFCWRLMRPMSPSSSR